MLLLHSSSSASFSSSSSSCFSSKPTPPNQCLNYYLVRVSQLIGWWWPSSSTSSSRFHSPLCLRFVLFNIIYMFYNPLPCDSLHLTSSSFIFLWFVYCRIISLELPATKLEEASSSLPPPFTFSMLFCSSPRRVTWETWRGLTILPERNKTTHTHTNTYTYTQHHTNFLKIITNESYSLVFYLATRLNKKLARLLTTWLIASHLLQRKLVKTPSIWKYQSEKKKESMSQLVFNELWKVPH